MTENYQDYQEEVLERLIAAKSYINKGWTQGCYARNKHGEHVAYYSDEAVSFCMLGALKRANMSGDNRRPLRTRTIAETMMCFVNECIRDHYPDFAYGPSFNDVKGQSKVYVLNVLDCAIERAKR